MKTLPPRLSRILKKALVLTLVISCIGTTPGLAELAELDKTELKNLLVEGALKRLESRNKRSSKKGGRTPILFISTPRHSLDMRNVLKESELGQKSTIALFKFNHLVEYSLNSDLSICAAQVSSSLTQHLADLNRFNIITRDHIDTVLNEQRFSNSGSVDSATAIELGRLSSAKYLIVGQVQLCTSNSAILEKQAKNNQGAHAIQNEAQTSQQHAGGYNPISLLHRASKAIGKKIRSSRNEGEEAEENESTGLLPRSVVLAQIQLIEAENGTQIFTTSIRGEYVAKADSNITEERELIGQAANDLADQFVDNFFSRPEAKYLSLYMGKRWDFDRGVDLIALGDCKAAENHFATVYQRHKGELGDREIARLMYNHSVSLMCSDRADEALNRLWASLRLVDDPMTKEAISFTYDTIDQGREIKPEGDSIIHDVQKKEFPRQLIALAGKKSTRQ